LVLASGEECAPPPPPAYAEDPASAFYALGLEVYTTSVNLTEEQHTIARYWADISGTTGKPPGHWVTIVLQLETVLWLQALSLSVNFGFQGRELLLWNFTYGEDHHDEEQARPKAEEEPLITAD